jgi:hypothetical protein
MPAKKEAAAGTSWHEKLLQELIYERVMLHIDLVDLIGFERELEEGIKRAMQASGVTADEWAARARQYLDDAWERAEKEWDCLRAEPGDGDCPLCDGPLGDQDGRSGWQAVG